MRGLDIHQNIPVSVTKLRLGFRVCFICSQLNEEKLFLVHTISITGPSIMSLMLEAKSIPSFIIKPSLILVAHKDDLGWYVTYNQQGQMFVQRFNRIVSKPNVTPGQIPYCTTDCIPKYLMFQEN